MRSLRVSNSGPEGSRVYFGQQSEYSVGTDGSGQFLVTKGRDPAPLLAIDPSGVLSINSRKTQVAGLDIGSTDGLSIRGIRQWQLVERENFGQDSGLGWSHPQVTQCAGVFMLGGYCKFSSGEVNKTFTGLPPHTQLRVVATYHFIDRWIGEAGFMKLNIGQAGSPVVVWSEQHSQGPSTNGLSLCGQSSTPEGKFAVSIDVTVPHSQAAVTVSFGSTMESADPCDESWGVSGMEIYIRT